jgi:cell wall-associated NlpC family hydrolase
MVSTVISPPATYKPPKQPAGKAGAAVNAAYQVQEKTNTVLGFAASQIGKPYVFGSGPDFKSFDCSDLIQAAYKGIGIKLPRTTFGQIKAGKPVDLHNIQPGDLVFPSNHHVVLYVGNGKVIAAPHTGALVQYQNLSDFGNPVAIRRVLPDGQNYV